MQVKEFYKIHKKQK